MSDLEKTTRPIYLWVGGIVLTCVAWLMKSAYAEVEKNSEFRHKSGVEIEHIKKRVDDIWEKIK